MVLDSPEKQVFPFDITRNKIMKIIMISFIDATARWWTILTNYVLLCARVSRTKIEFVTEPNIMINILKTVFDAAG